MFRLDDQFLKDIGLDNLPEEQKQPFLQHIYSELELRVGTRLSDGLSDAQLEEFEQIIDRNQEKIQSWLGQYAPNYAQDEAFARLQQAAKLEANDPRLVAEYAATKWLEVNRPDYRQVVAQVLDELKKEIMANKDAILGGITGASVPQPPVSPQSSASLSQSGQLPQASNQEPPVSPL